MLARHAEPMSVVREAHLPLLADAENGLTAAGWAAATALAEALAGLGGKCLLYASPIRRASETATCVAERLQVPIQYEASLAERSFDALPQLTGRLSQQLQEDGLLAPECSLMGEESVAQHRARVASWFGHLQQQLLAKPDQHVIVVCHGGTIEHLMGLILHAPVAALARYYLRCDCAHFHQLSTALLGGQLAFILEGSNRARLHLRG
ncbi:histidine phosphatase family protein [Chitinimonas prasina]|nr:histidine phosphatase family protein [Chitinimonas prasina]